MANENSEAEQHEIMDAADAEAAAVSAKSGAGDKKDVKGAADAAGGEADAAAVREASAKGWVPKDKYTGDPDKWVDAVTFVDRGKKFNVNLQREVAELKATVSTFKKTAADFKKYHEESLKAKDVELQDAIKQLRLDHKAAVRDGNDEEAIEMEDRLDALKTDSAKVKAELANKGKEEESSPTDAAMQEWIADGNEWFTTDIKLQQYAVATGAELIQKGETLRGRPFLDKIAEMMKEEFPAKFGNQRRNREGSAEGGSSAAGSRGGKSERDLPAADRQLMNEFVAAGFMTKEKFLAEYRW